MIFIKKNECCNYMYVNMYIMGSDIFDVWKKLFISFFKYIFLISGNFLINFFLIGVYNV